MLPKISYPIFTIKLPSTKKDIKIRQMLTKEQKILLVAKETGQIIEMLSAIRQVCNNCLETEGLDINALTTFDVEYLFLKLREISVSNISEQSYTDLEDQKNYDFEIDLSKIEILFPEDAPSNTVQINDLVSIVLKYPQAKIYDDEELFNEESGDVTDKIAVYCLDKVFVGDNVIECNLQTKEEIKQFIDNLDLKSFDKIRKFIEKLPKLYHEISYKNSLDHDRKIVLTALNDFFTF